ncbi:NAD-dependent epimerase/dehydratase family protein [Thalassotalea sp. PLHSN55]|uniref:NAD-dependent epimerase/dehydratase family protein n=1 Tax=Thalassotalea sp. PLHSN55 TaxID=3435888 RepID=UPI003F82E32F
MTSELASVSIIGCGWLGKPLAKSLHQQGCSVIATSQRVENFADIEATGAKALQLILPFDKAIDAADIDAIFSQQNIVICLPPQIKRGKTDYPEKIAQIVQRAEQAVAKKIMLISSTAVYGGLSGSVDEETALNYSAPKVEILAGAEQAALAFSGQATVLRLAGLIGPKRHPGRFLTMKKQLANSEVAVNLIHLDDVIGLITELLGDDAPTGVFNGVNDTHVSKKSFYQQAATAMGLSLPEFSPASSETLSKVVMGHKAKTQLNYQMKHDDLLAWLALGEQ